MEMRGLMGGFYRISEWIMRLSVTNLLWILTSFPIWYLLLVMLTASGVEDPEAFFLQTMILIGVLSPFTLFPSTSAMFSVVRKWVLGDTDVPLFKTFFRSYKENYKQAMLGGLIYAVLLTVLIVDYRLYAQNIAGLGFLSTLFLFLIFLLIVSLFHFFSLVSHFRMSTLQIVKNALLLTIGRPFRTLLMALFTFGVFWLSTRFTFLIPFFMGSVIAYVVYHNFHMMLGKMMEKAEAYKKQNESGDGDTDALSAGESELADERRDKKA
jgi:uncharacterized membrane protein YesL